MIVVGGEADSAFPWRAPGPTVLPSLCYSTLHAAKMPCPARQGCRRGAPEREERSRRVRREKGQERRRWPGGAVRYGQLQAQVRAELEKQARNMKETEWSRRETLRMLALGVPDHSALL
jgi:hypothetical protein